MESDDVVEPIDAAFQALLALTAENTKDDEKRDMLIDGIVTAPPVAEWPKECQQSFYRPAVTYTILPIK
ncbi:hypothetical protein BST27_00910 [Mycobacterium intermedium]|uniref:Uncharacterized protein n=1 Tax=Mycobacterium intermedium TaxID=28445 RepID=A0A1E3SG18_MYCIE|nr:hypothetical protein [Mycobacterium intermedium]MCV6963662.1 hypothetical protein [Mycobacterium intermedium]ODR01035.1 hypothetical protein BHQ20_10080 [Mycobacterium intermedium]OPE52448.1 hypothetical protein BV508_02475 [Mycobacterium intermedium]ORB10450.1 hypothetical protein BST27_00910 [Mycobacterium intermedium]